MGTKLFMLLILSMSVRYIYNKWPYSMVVRSVGKILSSRDHIHSKSNNIHYMTAD